MFLLKITNSSKVFASRVGEFSIGVDQILKKLIEFFKSDNYQVEVLELNAINLNNESLTLEDNFKLWKRNS